MPKSKKGMSVEDLKRKTAKRLAQQKKEDANKKGGGAADEKEKVKPHKMTVEQLKELTKQRQLTQQQNASQNNSNYSPPRRQQPISAQTFENNLSKKYFIQGEELRQQQQQQPQGHRSQFTYTHQQQPHDHHHHRHQQQQQHLLSAPPFRYDQYHEHLRQQQHPFTNSKSFHYQQQHQYYQRSVVEFSPTESSSDIFDAESRFMIGQRSFSAPSSNSYPHDAINRVKEDYTLLDNGSGGGGGSGSSGSSGSSSSNNHNSIGDVRNQTFFTHRSLSAPSSKSSDNDEYDEKIDLQSRINELLLSWSSDSDSDNDAKNYIKTSKKTAWIETENIKNETNLKNDLKNKDDPRSTHIKNYGKESQSPKITTINNVVRGEHSDIDSPIGPPLDIVATVSTTGRSTALDDQISLSVAEFVLDEPNTPPTSIITNNYVSLEVGGGRCDGGDKEVSDSDALNHELQIT